MQICNNGHVAYMLFIIPLSAGGAGMTNFVNR